MEMYTTIRLIEGHGPCTDEYYSFLRDFGGAPINDGDYPGYTPKKTKIGPDDKIPIMDVMKKKSSGDMSGSRRICWLSEHDCILPTKQAGVLDNTSIDLSAMENLHIKVALICDAKTIKKLLAL